MTNVTKPAPLAKTLLGLACLLGVAMIANGVFMLLKPETWYLSVPGVGRTGPFNQHFIRDLGILYILIGSGFIAGVRRRDLRVWIWGPASLWLAFHAVFHIWEVLVGLCTTAVFL